MWRGGKSGQDIKKQGMQYPHQVTLGKSFPGSLEGLSRAADLELESAFLTQYLFPHHDDEDNIYFEATDSASVTFLMSQCDIWAIDHN